MNNAIDFDGYETILGANLQKSLARENFSVQVLATIALFVISFFFIFWVGSYFEVDIFPFENRVNNITTFHTNIFDKYVDSIVITLLTLLWLCLSIRGKTRIISAIGYGALTISALLTNFTPLFEVAVLVSIPLITSFFVYHNFSDKKIIQFQKNLLMSFFSFFVLLIALFGFIITLLTLSSSSGIPGLINNHVL